MSDPAEDVIKIFKHAINQSATGLRIKSLFGHLAPESRKRLRQWFMKSFGPNPMDHISFIHANRQHFKYDMRTGLITVNREYNPKAEKRQAQADSGDKENSTSS